MSSKLYSVCSESDPFGIVALRDPATRLEVETTLHEHGFQVRGASSGPDVLVEIADAIFDGPDATRPRLLVLDDRLYGVLGSSIAAGIRALGWKTLVVLIGADMGHSSDTVIILREDADALEICAAIEHSLSVEAPKAEPVIETGREAESGVLRWSLDLRTDVVSVGVPASSQPSIWQGSLSTWLSLVHPEDRPRLTRGIAGQFLGSLDALTTRIRWQRPDAEYRHVEFRCAPGPGNRLLGAMVDVATLEGHAYDEPFEERRQAARHGSEHRQMHFNVMIRDIEVLVDELGPELVTELMHRVAARARAFLRNGDRVHLGGLGLLNVQVTGDDSTPDPTIVKARLHQALQAPVRAHNITIALNLLVVPVDASWQAASVVAGRGARAP